MALLTDYPERIRNGLPHEVPTYAMPDLLAILDAPDENIAKAMSEIISKYSGNAEAWRALGEEVHARLSANYPRMLRGDVRTLGSSFPVKQEKLQGTPLDWSVGALTPTARFFDNIVTATKLDINIGVIPGGQFPYFSHPESFASYVVETTRKYL